MDVDRAALARGIDRFDAGAFWDAHEAWEDAWAASHGVVRHFLGGLILLAAAMHQARALGSARGGRRNYAKALRHLALVPDRYAGVDVRELEARVHAALRHPDAKPRVPRPDQETP